MGSVSASTNPDWISTMITEDGKQVWLLIEGHKVLKKIVLGQVVQFPLKGSVSGLSDSMVVVCPTHNSICVGENKFISRSFKSSELIEFSLGEEQLQELAKEDWNRISFSPRITKWSLENALFLKKKFDFELEKGITTVMKLEKCSCVQFCEQCLVKPLTNEVSDDQQTPLTLKDIGPL